MRTSLYPPGFSHKHHQNITGSIKIEVSKPAYTSRNDKTVLNKALLSIHLYVNYS